MRREITASETDTAINVLNASILCACIHDSVFPIASFGNEQCPGAKRTGVSLPLNVKIDTLHVSAATLTAHIRELATRRSVVGGRLAVCTGRTGVRAVLVYVATEKQSDGFLRFCMHAWFSDDFLRPRCFPRDLYAVNIAGECRLPLPPSLSFFLFRMQRDREKSFSGRRGDCEARWCRFYETTCEFAMM